MSNPQFKIKELISMINEMNQKPYRGRKLYVCDGCNILQLDECKNLPTKNYGQEKSYCDNCTHYCDTCKEEYCEQMDYMHEECKQIVEDDEYCEYDEFFGH